MIRSFLRDCSGASASEYALLVVMVGLGIGAASLALGANVGAGVNTDAQEIYDLNTAP